MMADLELYDPWCDVDHELKCWPDPFNATWDLRKPYEFRKDDRPGGFQVGQSIRLTFYDPALGRIVRRIWMDHEITYVTRGPDFGVPDGYAVLGIRLLRNSTGIGRNART